MGKNGAVEDDWPARLRLALHRRGERMTPAREAVLSVLLAAGTHHLAAEEIATLAAQRTPGVHRASVHRTLELLVQLGLVQHVHAGHGPARYHLADHHSAHVHLHCHRCGELFDLPPDLLDDVAERLRRQYGFELDAGHMALSGTCAACSAI